MVMDNRRNAIKFCAEFTFQHNRAPTMIAFGDLNEI